VGASDDQTSFLLIKPDGWRDDRLGPFLSQYPALAHPTEDLVVRFNPEDVGHFWYQYPESNRPVAAAVLRAFIAGKPMRALVVQSPSAIRLVDQIKGEVRTAFGSGPFSNLVHAPASVEECRVQLPILRGARGSVRPPPIEMPLWPPPATKRRLRAAAAIAVAVLEGAERAGTPEDVPSSDGQRSLWFVRDRQKCLDHAVEALLRTVPSLNLEQAIIAVVSPEGSTNQLLIRGDNAQVTSLQHTLEGEDVVTRVV
jgi:nucleoside diphosphate kinase